MAGRRTAPSGRVIGLLVLAGCASEGPVVAVAAAPSASASARPAPLPCPGPTFSAGGRVFCVNPRPLPFDAAEEACRTFGGHLAKLASGELVAGAAAALRAELGLAGGFWMGLVEPTRDRWAWVDAGAPSFGSWAPGEPNDAGGEDCAELVLPAGQWNDLGCQTARPFVCERRTEAWGCTGTSLTTPFGTYCVHVSLPRTWSAAQDACQANGGSLLELETQAEADALLRATGARLGGDRLWIGLHDRAAEGRFVWLDGYPLTDSSFAPGEPNDAGGAEDCTEMFADGGRWNDIPCGLARPSLCGL